MSIIDNFESAKIHFTGCKLYIQHHIQAHSAEYDAMQHEILQEQSESIAQEARVIWTYEWHKEAKGEWITLSTSTCEFWECQAQSCLAMHSTICNHIIQSFQQNPSKSFRQVAIDIWQVVLCHYNSTLACFSWQFTVCGTLSAPVNN